MPSLLHIFPGLPGPWELRNSHNFTVGLFRQRVEREREARWELRLTYPALWTVDLKLMSSVVQEKCQLYECPHFRERWRIFFVHLTI